MEIKESHFDGDLPECRLRLPVEKNDVCVIKGCTVLCCVS